MNFCFLILIVCLLSESCKNDEQIYDLDKSAYPKEVGKIILSNCAQTGCHTSNDKIAAANLSLSTYEEMLQGSSNGSVAIQSKPNLSPIFIFSNTFKDLGLMAEPTMPINSSPLKKEHMIVLKNWILEGLPNRRGDLPFKENWSSKIYITNQGCDLVAVMDAKTKQVYKYVNVGVSFKTESPHQVRVSEDGKYWYVVFSNGEYLQKYSTDNDALVGQVYLGPGSWNTFASSPDGNFGYAVNWAVEGSVACIDLLSMKIIANYEGSGLLTQPHGSLVSRDGNTLYITAQSGNFFYKVDVSDKKLPDIEQISIEKNAPPTSISKLNIHEVIFNKDASSLIFSCMKSNDIRIVDVKNNELLAHIILPSMPFEMAISNSKNLLFVTCTEDSSLYPSVSNKKRGAVCVIDLKNYSLLKTLYAGFQPHGLVVDEKNQFVIVANRNSSSDGPTPHHSNDCGGRNGTASFIDLNNLTVQQFKHELSVDPYSCDIKR